MIRVGLACIAGCSFSEGLSSVAKANYQTWVTPLSGGYKQLSALLLIARRAAWSLPVVVLTKSGLKIIFKDRGLSARPHHVAEAGETLPRRSSGRMLINETLDLDGLPERNPSQPGVEAKLGHSVRTASTGHRDLHDILAILLSDLGAIGHTTHVNLGFVP
ncbi:MAG: hypothetical protein AAB478_04390 [Patescibacteria group bacterium]